MTPYQFGYKIAAQTIPAPAAPTRAPTPVAAVKQPMEQAVSRTAKNIPGMLNMARASGTNPINIMNRVEHGIKTRTGQFPNNWETTEALMRGLPYPYPESR